jgi:adenylosuccinate lyase
MEAEARYQAWLTWNWPWRSHGRSRPGSGEAVPKCGPRPGCSVERIEAIEAETKHDVIAFLPTLKKRGAILRFLHLGNDLVRRAGHPLGLLLTKAAGMLLADVEALMAALKKRPLNTRTRS